MRISMLAPTTGNAQRSAEKAKQKRTLVSWPALNSSALSSTPSLPGRGILWAVNQHRDGRIEDGSNLMRQSVADSNRTFWTGQKPLWLIQWVGVALLLVCSTVLATSSGLRIFAGVIG